jgi:ADP-ribose pyrophosphatase YjhB (NUDIX family)
MVTAQVIEAAEDVVEKQSPRGSLIAIVGRERYGHEWALPKGRRITGASRPSKALRGVKEETGLDARVVAPGGRTFTTRGERQKPLCIGV